MVFAALNSRFKSYLDNRKQPVFLNGDESKTQIRQKKIDL